MYHTAPRVAGENMPLKLGLPKIIPHLCLILSKTGTCKHKKIRNIDPLL